jgi:hypothetical protein
MSSPLHSVALVVTLGAAAGCVSLDDPELGRDQQEQVMLNQVMLNQVMLNGLTGTVHSLKALIENPLSSATFGPGGPLPVELHDENAREFMKYLASCALTDTQWVSWTDPFDQEEYEWQGAVGLCPAWGEEAPDQDCLEIVTACLLARENRQGKSVAISQRGRLLSDKALPLASRVAAKRSDIDGNPIESFLPCPVNLVGPERDCGWKPEASLLGTCTPGQQATLHCKTGGGRIVLRVCDGILGCNHGDDAVLAEAAACAPNGPQEVTFTCGADGAFAAMVGPPASSSKMGSLPEGVSGAADWPASERALFALVEGAFYGNLFDPGRRHPGVTVTVSPTTGAVAFDIITAGPGAVIYGDAHVCHAPEWSNPKGYMHDRLCALVVDDNDNSETLCVSNMVGPCIAPLGAGACGSADGPPIIGDRDYADCEDSSSQVRSWPLTVFLHGACDLVRRPSLCQRRDR